MKEKHPVEGDPARSRRSFPLVANERPIRPSKIYHKPRGENARTGRWEDSALIVIFLISIALPLTAMILRLDSTSVSKENRTLSSRPALELSLPALAGFSTKYEAYFNDQFGFRPRLIHWQNLVKVALLGVSPPAKVVLGRNDWLFYGDAELDYYRAIRPFTPAQLEIWRGALESRRDWLAARRVPYIVVIAPNKSTIYPEHMPPAFNKVHANSCLDQLMAHLKAHSSVRVIDLREPLLAAKAQQQVYFRTDSHWNNRGAHVGYGTIMGALATSFPDLKATPRSAFKEVEITGPGKDLPLIMAMQSYYREAGSDIQIGKPKFARAIRETPAPGDAPPKYWRFGENVIFEQPNQELPRAVVFRDSFCIALIPMLVDHFHRIVFCWQYTFDYEFVERERPDVVIQEIVERALMVDFLPVQ